MNIESGYKDVTKAVFADNRDEHVAPEVRECWAEQQKQGWQSAQSAGHMARNAKCGRHKAL